MLLFRLFGLMLIAAAAVTALLDGISYAKDGAAFRSLGEHWYALDRGSLNLLQAVTQRYLLPEIWDPGAIWLLTQPAAAVLLVLGLVLVLVFRRRSEARPQRRTPRLRPVKR